MVVVGSVVLGGAGINHRGGGAGIEGLGLDGTVVVLGVAGWMWWSSWSAWLVVLEAAGTLCLRSAASLSPPSLSLTWGIYVQFPILISFGTF